MFGLFKKKEPVKNWGEFKELKKCNECGRLQKPFHFDFTDDACPDCGSRDISIVVARWEESVVEEGFFNVRVLHRNEIRT